MNLKTQQSKESWVFFLAWLFLLYSFFSLPTIITFLALTAEFITTHNPGLSGNKKKLKPLCRAPGDGQPTGFMTRSERGLQLQEAGHDENEIGWATNAFCNHLNRST